MTLQDIDDKYNKSISALKSLEQILKVQETSYDNHISRLGWLKHLADSAQELRRLEVEFLKVSQAAAAQAAARQQAAPVPQLAPQVVQPPAPQVVQQPAPQPAQPPAPQPVQEEDSEEAESSKKKTKKRL